MDLLRRSLPDYLKHRVGPTAELVNATRFPRGSSRVTWFVDYRPATDAPVRSVVFRGDPIGGSTIPSSLEQEYFMYDRLGRTAVPVAKVLWWESDPEWTDRPFYVREQIDGSWVVPNFSDPDPKYDSLRIETSKEHMRKLALVHTVDWKKLGFDERLAAPASEAQCAAHFIDGIVSRLESYQLEPLPLVVEAVAWLKERAPVAPRISLCKGTNGLGEEVFKDGVIVAMSDWEEASIGDPAADFASLQDFVPEIERDGRKLWGLEHALEYYRSVSGIDVKADNVRFYFMVRALGTVQYAHRAAVITARRQADIRQLWTGTEIAFLGKRMLAAAVGLGDPLDPAWFAELNKTIG
ncbi:MAG: phosphotransferase family protein [Steroidobacteraceae bacterium]